MATFDYRKFEHVFYNVKPFPSREFFQETEAIRRKFDGALFIDRVLKALGVGKGESFLTTQNSYQRSQIMREKNTNTFDLQLLQLRYTPPRLNMPSEHSTSRSARPT